MNQIQSCWVLSYLSGGDEEGTFYSAVLLCIFESFHSKTWKGGRKRGKRGGKGGRERERKGWSEEGEEEERKGEGKENREKMNIEHSKAKRVTEQAMRESIFQ